jgi:MFS family permease
MAYLGVSPQMHLAGVVLLCLVGSVVLLGKLEAAPLREADRSHAQAAPPRFATPTPAILLLVVVTLPAMVMEGAGFDWSAIYMRDVFASSAFLGGVAVATGAAAQALMRYFADGFVERHSPAWVARVLFSVLALGDVLVFVSGAPWLSLLGFALLGVGSSAIFPLAMSAAAQRQDRPSTVNVAALAQTAFVSFLLAPPLLGFVAQSFGIRWSFGIALPLVLASLCLSRVLGVSTMKKA